MSAANLWIMSIRIQCIFEDDNNSIHIIYNTKWNDVYLAGRRFLYLRKLDKNN